MVAMIWPSTLSIGRLFIILVGATCLLIAYNISFFPATVRNRSIISEHKGNLSFLANIRSDDVTVGIENAKVWTKNASLGRIQSSHLNTSQLASVTGTFQPVGKLKIWIYSAYFEVTDTGDAQIKGFGIAFRDVSKLHVFCHVNEFGKLTVIGGKMTAFSDSHPRRTTFTSTYFRCPVSQGSRPDFVSLTISKDKTDVPTNQLAVFYPQPKKYNITVCHPALYGPYNETLRIIMSIELNSVLGAEHFFVYNYNVSEETEIVLKEYEKDGVLTVIPWQVPKESNAWYYAQHSAINDCVYRNINLSTYVAIVDVDEFIIPAKASSWTDLIQEISHEYYGDTGKSKPILGSMAFESSFFRSQPAYDVWKQIMNNFSITQEEEEFITRFSLYPVLHFERTEPPFPFPKRSKSIVRPDLVYTAGIHHTRTHKKSAVQYVVSNKTALVNHYSMSNMKSRPRVLDISILRLKSKFFPRLKLAIDRFSQILA